MASGKTGNMSAWSLQAPFPTTCLIHSEIHLRSVRKLKSSDCVTMEALEWSGRKGLLNSGMSRALKTMLLWG